MALFRKFQHYLGGNPDHCEAIVYSNHFDLKSLIIIRKLPRFQVWWEETLGCCRFEIKFVTEYDYSIKQDALSCLPDLSPTKQEKASFGKPLRSNDFTPDTFINILAIEFCFEDNLAHLENSKHWIDILAITDHVYCDIIEI